MARKKKLNIYQARIEILSTLRAAGYAPGPPKQRQENPARPDHTALVSLLLAYECIVQLEQENSELGIRLTLAERGEGTQTP